MQLQRDERPGKFVSVTFAGLQPVRPGPRVEPAPEGHRLPAVVGVADASQLHHASGTAAGCSAEPWR